MIFIILFGALRILHRVPPDGRRTPLVHDLLSNLPGGVVGAVIAVMAMMSCWASFPWTRFEIIFIVLPITAPGPAHLDVSPMVIVGMNLQRRS